MGQIRKNGDSEKNMRWIWQREKEKKQKWTNGNSNINRGELNNVTDGK